MTTLGLKIPFTGLQKQYNNLRTEILDAIDAVLRSGQLMNGNNTAEFESWLARRNNVKHAVTCHSGTQALEIMAEYYAQQYDHTELRVLIPTLTYQATANAFLRAGWQVEFADVDRNGLVNYDTIDKDRVYHATVPIGLYGAVPHYPVDQFASGILLEDGAQHWLAKRSFGVANAQAISFDPMKNLSNYGNGGAVVTPDRSLMEFARSWRDNGKPSNTDVGTNSRMSEIDCATMLVKTKYIDQWQVRREKIGDYWCERLKDHASIRCLINERTRKGHCFHKFVIEVDNADVLQRNLDIRKIETKIHYRNPLHELPAYQQFAGPDMMSVASMLSRRVLSLPIYPELTDLEVEYIIDQLIDCV